MDHKMKHHGYVNFFAFHRTDNLPPSTTTSHRVKMAWFHLTTETKRQAELIDAKTCLWFDDCCFVTGGSEVHGFELFPTNTWKPESWSSKMETKYENDD
ncbi:hypothetical protein CHS0354_005343 [Potamilus streckersoni]|uniref:Uncharacterized protein n=1 Tax=Potamilus streckersoni TaxID=2493646 RepID=A0AAE0SGR3_9BIVA|nr:hypothetical protein CHS0354_005343 [Potamilus streckersoni]